MKEHNRKKIKQNMKVGDTVRIIKEAKLGSINKKGDVGIIVEITSGDIDRLNYKVNVEGREFNGTPNISNWHQKNELEIISDKTTREEL